MYIKCRHCDGSGRIPCPCAWPKTIETIYAMERTQGSYERLVVAECRDCGQLWKIRYQYDAGTGSDHIFLKPGESSRGYSFTLDEANEILKRRA